MQLKKTFSGYFRKGGRVASFGGRGSLRSGDRYVRDQYKSLQKIEVNFRRSLFSGSLLSDGKREHHFIDVRKIETYEIMTGSKTVLICSGVFFLLDFFSFLI